MDQLSKWYQQTTTGNSLSKEEMHCLRDMVTKELEARREDHDTKHLLILTVYLNALKYPDTVVHQEDECIFKLMLQNLQSADRYRKFMVQKCIVQYIISTKQVKESTQDIVQHFLGSQDEEVQLAALEVIVKLMSKMSNSDVKFCTFSILGPLFSQVLDKITKTAIPLQCIFHCTFMKLWAKLVKYHNHVSYSTAQERNNTSIATDPKEAAEVMPSSLAKQNTEKSQIELIGRYLFDKHLCDYLFQTAINQSSPYCAYQALKTLAHFLPYGTWLASAKTVAKVQVDMAESVIAHSRQLLNGIPVLPVKDFCATMGDAQGDNGAVLRRIMLLILRAMVIHAKYGSGNNKDLSIILSSLDQTLTSCKEHWLHDILSEQDDVMIEAMLCLLDGWPHLHPYLQYLSTSLEEFTSVCSSLHDDISQHSNTKSSIAKQCTSGLTCDTSRLHVSTNSQDSSLLDTSTDTSGNSDSSSYNTISASESYETTPSQNVPPYVCTSRDIQSVATSKKSVIWDDKALEVNLESQNITRSKITAEAKLTLNLTMYSSSEEDEEQIYPMKRQKVTTEESVSNPLVYADCERKDGEEDLEMDSSGKAKIVSDAEDNRIEIAEEEHDMAILAALHQQTNTVHVNTMLDKAMTVLIQLKFAIVKLMTKDLFPYSAKRLISLLERCEELYENEGGKPE